LLSKSVGPFGGSGKKHHKADSKADPILAATDQRLKSFSFGEEKLIALLSATPNILGL
jgi:hypothetical protein